MATGNKGPDWGRILLGGLALWWGSKAVTGKTPLDLLSMYADAEAERQRRLQETERRRRLLETPPQTGITPAPDLSSFLHLDLSLPAAPVPNASAPIAPPAQPKLSNAPAYTPSRDASWRTRIVHPSVVLILGKRGGGKSALGYRLLELFRFVAAPYVVGVPASSRGILPDWIGIAGGLEEIPAKAIVLIDEAYLAYHARGSMAARSRAMSQLVNLSRQREQTLLFIAQEARQVDRNIASSANVLVFKELGILQPAFERPELNQLTSKAKAAFGQVTDDKRRYAYVYAPDTDFEGLLESDLPSFWKPALTRLFAAEMAPASIRRPKVATPAEKTARAKALREQGACRSPARGAGVLAA